MSRRDQNKILFPAKVITNKDPMMLGRVRAFPTTENFQEIVKAAPSYCQVSVNQSQSDNYGSTDISDECKWTIDDPFMFLPLLPFFINTTPAENEYIHVIYSNKDYKYIDQFYIQGPLSSPMSIQYENYLNSETFMSNGVRNKNSVSIKNLDNTYKTDQSKGIFPEPGDNSLLGRGSSDVIVKKDEVLLRSGKYTGSLNPKQLPSGNSKRSFVQLSKFEQRKVDLPPYQGANLIEQVKVVQKVIEWNIFNLNTTVDAFTGEITLYNIKPDLRSNSKNFKEETDVSDLYSAPLYKVKFTGEKFVDVIYKINTFIKGVNDGTIFIDPATFYKVQGERFPFVFTPSKNVKLFLTNVNTTNTTEYNNALKFYQSIKYNQADKNSGFGLIFNNGKPGPLYDPKIEKVTPSEYLQAPITYASVGADKVYILSHESVIPSKGKINLGETLYGIPQEKFTDDIFSKTNSMVRGEELMEFLNLLTKFLVGHVHPFHGLPPVPVAIDGSTNTGQIFQSLLNAPNTILNQNIRLN